MNYSAMFIPLFLFVCLFGIPFHNNLQKSWKLFNPTEKKNLKFPEYSLLQKKPQTNKHTQKTQSKTSTQIPPHPPEKEKKKKSHTRGNKLVSSKYYTSIEQVHLYHILDNHFLCGVWFGSWNLKGP